MVRRKVPHVELLLLPHVSSLEGKKKNRGNDYGCIANLFGTIAVRCVSVVGHFISRCAGCLGGDCASAAAPGTQRHDDARLDGDHIAQGHAAITVRNGSTV